MKVSDNLLKEKPNIYSLYKFYDRTAGIELL